MHLPLARASLVALAAAALLAPPAPAADVPAAHEPAPVVWDSPSDDARGSMPLGNGDIALNAWVEPSGDLLFYIGKSDSWEDNSRLAKVGLVRVRLAPALLVPGAAFRQELSPARGEMVVTVTRPRPDGGQNRHKTTVRVWVDANHPVAHVAIASDAPVAASASFELWRTSPYTLPTIESTDVNLDRSRPDQRWNTTNPMPEVAGLHAVVARLLALPRTLLPDRDRAYLQGFHARVPALPTREADGVRMLAAAERFESKKNVENPELYTVFPFRLVSFEKPNAALGREALVRRTDRGPWGWRHEDVFMAYLGLADDARAYLVQRARSVANPQLRPETVRMRFPAFWGPNYDWIPDQCHGGVLMTALQAMLMQSEGDKI